VPLVTCASRWLPDRMTTLKKNVVANLAGSMCTAVMGVALVPLYLRYLGPEAYGLLAFSGIILAGFGIMDFGLATTMNRGLARLTAKSGSIAEQRDLLRSMELVYWGIAITAGLLTFAVAAPYVASWVHPEHLSRSSIVTAVRWMAASAALQFAFGLYQAALMGLQRHVLLNVILGVGGMLRMAGALGILALVSPTVEAFFIWQAIGLSLQLATVIAATWRSVSAPTAPRFTTSLLRGQWRFAAGVSANAMIGILLTQSDKVLLSGALPLGAYGYYALAGNVAATLWWLILPINTALFPRFSQLLGTGDETAVKTLYHAACQLMAFLILPVAGTMAFFSRTLILIWTGNPVTARQTSLLVTLLVIATALNGLASVPSYFQSAAGWPQLMMCSNLAAALVLIPAMVPLIARLGAPGAALAWLVLNLGYVLVTVPIMHRRLLKGEAGRWYVEDVLIPLITVVLVATAARLGMPADLPLMAAFRYVFLSLVAMGVAAILTLPRARSLLLEMLDRREEAVV
jgi:O-antigen/teichoic acid export membrane protein